MQPFPSRYLTRFFEVFEAANKSGNPRAPLKFRTSVGVDSVEIYVTNHYCHHSLQFDYVDLNEYLKMIGTVP